MIIVMTAVDCVRRGPEGWRMGRVGRREYSGERWEVSREMGGPDQGSKECGLSKTGEEESLSGHTYLVSL